PGDTITEDQGVVELMTDKATVTVPSPRAGKVVSLHGKEGEMAKVHHALLTLEVAGAAAAGAAPSATAQPAVAAATARATPVAAARAVAAAPAKGPAPPGTRRIAPGPGPALAASSGSRPA